MPEEATKRSFILRDNLVATLLLGMGYDIQPQKDVNGRVFFLAPEEAREGIKKIYLNEQVGAADVLRDYETIKTYIYGTRGGPTTC
jgi:hypothetical protein